MSLRILIVDDSTSIRFKLRAFLKEQGHQVVGEAENGLEAIEMYRKLRPDCVTLDIVMPVMDGLTSLEQLRNLDPRSKVIMLSSAATQTNRDRARRHGAMRFLAKPVNPQELADALDEVQRQLLSEQVA